MKENKEVKISFWASHLTTIVSVTLVLILAGIISLIWIGATQETRKLKERIELSAVMADSVSDAQAQALSARLKKEKFVKDVRFVSKDQALKEWTEATGENLIELYDVNPLTPEVSFTLKADWSSPENIEIIRKRLTALPEVQSVGAPDTDMIRSMNANIANLTLVLGIVAAVMLVISFVLINNTVQLTIYSRRFTIHTMQLVGATNGFIRRPIIMSNMTGGLISGVLASLLIMVIVLLAPEAGVRTLPSEMTWPVIGIVSGALILMGMILCALAAWIASTRYLRKDYDELFR